MKKITLTQGQFALVDDEDYEKLSKFKWRASSVKKNKYAVYSFRDCDGLIKCVLMHRLILGIKDKKIHCDHINGDGLDNRKYNIRACTRSENMMNRGLQSNNTSGFKGVHWHKQSGKWHSRIKINGKKIHLGAFDDKNDAARAYDIACHKIHGDFSRPNFE